MMGPITKAASVASVLLTIIIASVDCTHGSLAARLLNSDFDLCENNGVACEWVFKGDGKPVNQDGQQGIADLPSLGSATFSQVVPFCSPGGTYRFSAQMSSPVKIGANIEVGIDPTGSRDPQHTIWRLTSSPGGLSVEGNAIGTSIVVYIRVTNHGAVPVTVFIDSTAIIPVGPARGLGSFSDVQDQAVRSRTETELAAARALLSKGEFEQARAALEELSNKPDAELPRSVAAEALIHLQETKHADQYKVYKESLDKQDVSLGVPELRAIRSKYPDQEEACALATCKIGEFYLGHQILPMAKELLEIVLTDFPDTEGAGWARMNLVNAHLWSGEVRAASVVVEQIRERYRNGHARIEQLAWADKFYRTQVAKSPEEKEEAGERLWNDYKTEFPEVAIRSKVDNAERRFNSKRIYQGIDDVREILALHPMEMKWSIPGRLMLSHYLHSMGNDYSHEEEAFRLLDEIETSPDASDEIREITRKQRQGYSRGPIQPKEMPRYGMNILSNADFTIGEPTSHVQSRKYPGWTIPPVLADSPNWMGLDEAWRANAITLHLDHMTPAWNSINYGKPSPEMRSSLVHDAVIVAPSAAYRAEAWTAVEAWEAGLVSDASFEILVAFQDCFQRPLDEQKTEFQAFLGESREWIPITLEGVTPPGARFAEFCIRFNLEGKGHHAVAITHASLVLEGDNNE